MDARYEVDIDGQKIRFEGEWVGCAELADKIRRMIESQDFRIGMAGAALEYLQQTLLNARKIEVRMAPEEAEVLEQIAARAGIPVSTFARQAIQAYIVSQPIFGEAKAAAVPPQFTAITTEPIKPGEEGAAVTLTERKEQSSAKVLVDPSLQSSKAPGESIEMSWFKK